MWMFLTSRIRTWLVLAVLVPMITVAIRTLRRRLEARSGATPAVRALTRLERLAERARRKEQTRQ
jgi:hypothetical protein